MATTPATRTAPKAAARPFMLRVPPLTVTRRDFGSTPLFEVIDDWTSLSKVEGDWKALWRRARRPFVLQSFEAARAIHRMPLLHCRTRLWCLIGRVEGMPAIIWPFVIHNNHGWRLAMPLASHLDCSDPLVLDCADYRDHVQNAWSFALRECPCDFFHLQ